MVKNSTPDLIVSAEWLRSHLDDPQVVIVDCRFSLADPELGRQQYLAGHIPNAHYLDLNRDLSSPVQKHGGRHPLPNLEQLAAKFSKMGIRSGENPTLVIAYDDSRFAFASRLWWLLSYLGHDRVALLDGGFTGWSNAAYPISTELPVPLKTPVDFIPNLQSDRVVDIEVVKAKKDLPNVALVDSREGDRYRGEREPIDPITGHIPGAVNYPWQEVTDSQGYVLADRRSRWQAVEDRDEIIVYCGSGVTACVNLLSLKLAGLETGKLYAGSWSDWCSYQA
ncbi:sulfurtransferase [Tumidithrix elongata RA019]|uniref:Sulfurtransferase n=1 Tax=Tumidithrix elongata BACA0141 TaxID=2716417 RepID=A0AAW9PWY4_9CYAN|nr:sulfurtransferase [Tumidithrix elongata RA019]